MLQFYQKSQKWLKLYCNIILIFQGKTADDLAFNSMNKAILERIQNYIEKNHDKY